MEERQDQAVEGTAVDREPPVVEVVIEVPRGSFLKRGSTGVLDFVSPLPCPFNYGSVPSHIGLEGDLLDAAVLGPRLPRGTRVSVPARGAVGFVDRNIYDDKLICSASPLQSRERTLILWFFRVYGLSKRLLNVWRRRPGRTASDGWGDARAAIARAKPRDNRDWPGPAVPY